MNGLPVAVIELKNPADENATIRHAFNQLQTYKADIPTLFAFNELLLISDGLEARMGTITSGWDRFMPWRTTTGTDYYPPLSSPSPGASRHPLPKGEGSGKLPSPAGRRAGDEGSKEREFKCELEVALLGVFEKRRFLDLILNFVVFEDDLSACLPERVHSQTGNAQAGGATVIKKLAAYHQFHAVNKAIACTFSACGIKYDSEKLIGRFPAFTPKKPGMVREEQPLYGPDSDHFGGQRIGVVWHTQGSGKSLSMTFYAGKVIRHPGMENPTLVIITDRNDLDDQLFGTFSRCSDLLRQNPVQAGSRAQLQRLLDVPAGGVVFTTIQKFLPENKGETYPRLSNRKNIVVIADEAHRSQYDFIDGFARHMHDALPNASFIGFTATPIERDDRSTPAVFGYYIDKYDILRAVEDGATVPIYYEGRLARIELNDDERPRIDPAFEEITEGEEEAEKQRLRTKWAALEGMVGTEKRIGLAKATVEGERRSREEMDAAIRQLVSRAVASDQVVDIFAAAGLKKPDISILSDDFLLEVRALPQRNLAVELLRKLLNDEIKARSRKNVVEARSFAEMLEEAVRKYQNRAIEAAQIIEELIRLAKEMQEARIRGEALGLTDDEVAFYDALEVNDSAVKVLGDECLRKIAQELVTTVRRSVTIDWTVRENARAKIRAMVKRILRKYGYPPDKQEKATHTVLEQAEVLCQDWMG